MTRVHSGAHTPNTQCGEIVGDLPIQKPDLSGGLASVLLVAIPSAGYKRLADSETCWADQQVESYSTSPWKIAASMDPSKMTEPKEDVDTVPSHIEPIHDDVFGEITEDGPNFRNVQRITAPMTRWSAD